MFKLDTMVKFRVRRKKKSGWKVVDQYNRREGEVSREMVKHDASCCMHLWVLVFQQAVVDIIMGYEEDAWLFSEAGEEVLRVFKGDIDMGVFSEELVDAIRRGDSETVRSMAFFNQPGGLRWTRPLGGKMRERRERNGR